MPTEIAEVITSHPQIDVLGGPPDPPALHALPHPVFQQRSGKECGKNKGPDEIEDRSYHQYDLVTGQPISRRRRAAAANRETFYGVGYNADGSSYIQDKGEDDDEPSAAYRIHTG